MILAIDFDGVLHDYKHPIAGRRMGAPVPLAPECVTVLKEMGHAIIIYSCKPSQVIAEWMSYYNIPYDAIASNGKPVADVYIDDKSMKFINWTQAMSELADLIDNQ